MTDDVPPKRPRGRPRLTAEQRAASAAERARKAAEANLRSTHRAREGKVLRSLFLTEEQAERLERLMDVLQCTSAGALVDELVAAATAPVEDDDE